MHGSSLLTQFNNLPLEDDEYVVEILKRKENRSFTWSDRQKVKQKHGAETGNTKPDNIALIEH